MVSIDILLDIAIILFVSKIFGLVMRKIGIPQVVGYLLAGLLIGPAIWGELFNGWSIVGESDVLNILAEIGVIMIMFSAGLETDIKEMKKSGGKATLIAMGGVLLPMALGFAIAIMFLGTENLLRCVFVGTILTATSVGITVATLKELGVLKSKVGNAIVSAAIIDDIIGMIILSIVIGFKDVNENPLIVTGKIVLFFVCAIAVGILIKIIFQKISAKHPHSRRVPIMSLAVCFLYAWAAEKLFGVADITGAYIAGLILSFNKKDAEYVDRKIEINSYMLFAPLFFANIGIKISFQNFTPELLVFGLCFVLVGILGKIVGSGGFAKLLGFNLKDSTKIGVGMIARGEVALIVTQKGISAGLIEPQYMTVVVMLILVSSLLAPILLKLLYKGDTFLDTPEHNHIDIEKSANFAANLEGEHVLPHAPDNNNTTVSST
ncbi:MAG: cation:proton antiporter [Clostridia bacterium]|nr:cation:proton antiporter [Clostridia bacterium]